MHVTHETRFSLFRTECTQYRYFTAADRPDCFACCVLSIQAYFRRIQLLERTRREAGKRTTQDNSYHHRARTASRSRDTGQEISKDLEKANVILQQINLPWESLFDSIEHVATEDIALLSLQPNVTNRTLRIRGEARNMAVLLDFVEAMEREVIFEKAHLVNYKIKQDSPYRPIDFLLTAVWTART